VLSHFSAEEWCEAQGSDQCIQRIAELKAKWGNDCDVTALRRETPEVQMYGRWWSDIYRGKDGVWRLRKTLLAKRKPEEKLRLPLVPVAWRESVWRCVHVLSVSHLGLRARVRAAALTFCLAGDARGCEDDVPRVSRVSAMQVGIWGW
jgi:hypothetical protein